MMAARTRTHAVLRVAPFALFCLAAMAVCPAIGSVKIDIGEALRNVGAIDQNLDASILFLTRVPRILLAALTGAALAVSGAAFQALLRNPLATPYTLGISSGGALGAVLAIKLGLDVTLWNLTGVPIAAFLGSTVAIGLVYALAHARGRLPTPILLLAGVSMAFLFSALILFAHYFADFTESHQMVRWLMGGLDVIGYRSIASILPLWGAGLALLLFLAGDLDQLSLGEQMATGRGVDVGRSQKLCYVAASLLTSAVVSLAGPIGFVGLIVPHAVRFLIGPLNRVLLPACIFAGAGFLVICDTVARTVLAPVELPVGILTAMIGGPFFIGLLFREKRKLAIQ